MLNYVWYREFCNDSRNKLEAFNMRFKGYRAVN